jgi:transposase
MANRGLEMYQIHQIIKLHNDGKSCRRISKYLNLSRKSVSKYITLYQSTGLTFEQINSLSEHELSSLIRCQEAPNAKRLDILQSRFMNMESELKRTGVTKQLLWTEYKVEHPSGYNLTQFCKYYRDWSKSGEASFHFDHKAGDKMFVDFAGKKLQYTDRNTGEVHSPETFIAILGASQNIYVEAVESQKKTDFFSATENAMYVFGGVPAAIVPDNLKSAVSKANNYEPDINESFAAFGRHYGATILPARGYKPKDKALVENAVTNVYRNIYAPLRNQIFYSLAELNTAIREKLDIFLNKKFQNKDYSRNDLFIQIEKEALKPLPPTRFEFREYRIATISKTYHIFLDVDKHYYSVPFRYIGKKVKIEFARSWVAIYYKGERIAYHQRDKSLNGYTTIKEHMPAHHRFVSEWSPEKFISWARQVGQETESFIKIILETKSHPEQAYKSCVGILSYNKKVGSERLNLACRRADEFGSHSYKAVKNILNGAYERLSTQELSQYKTPEHENIRGADYYSS